MLGRTTGGQALVLQKKMKGQRLFLKKKMTGPTLFFDEKNDGAETFFGRNHIHSFFVIDAFLSNARCRMCHMLRYCPVYYYSSLRIVIIPFLYDLKGAFDSIQMKGQRLFLTGKMTGQTLFLKKKMTGQGLFSREKMKGQRLFSRRKNSVCPAHVPIIFAPSLKRGQIKPQN